MITESIAHLLTHATAKALATQGSDGINVVPVSSIKVVGDTVRLIDYFMETTSHNIHGNNKVSLVCRKDMIGYQIKGYVEYLESGELFEQACVWIKPIHPDRTVKALIVLHPEEIKDIAPAKNTEEEVAKEIHI